VPTLTIRIRAKGEPSKLEPSLKEDIALTSKEGNAPTSDCPLYAHPNTQLEQAGRKLSRPNQSLFTTNNHSCHHHMRLCLWPG